MNTKKSITVEIRGNSLSIQGSGVSNNTKEAADLLQAAADALKSKMPSSTHGNENFYKK